MSQELNHILALACYRDLVEIHVSRVSCAHVGALLREFVCAKGTRCEAPSQTCVRDVPAVGAGQPCGTTAKAQVVA